MENAIEVRGLTKRYGDFVALGGVDFTVPAGTVFGLLGPNGAGKTTTVRILATVLKGDGGVAKILGYDVSTRGEEVRYRIGLAGQFAAVDENLTGRENLRLVGKLGQLRRELLTPRADELLERFRLTAAANKPVKTYSGGMRRRLDIGAALMTRPEVLFLDEPTTGLDIHSRNELWNMIRELVHAGTTVLLTTQYLEEADQLADRIAVVDGGLVIANDTPEQLKRQLGSTVVDLVFDEQELAQAVAAGLESQFPAHVEMREKLVRIKTDDSVRALDTLLPQLKAAHQYPARLFVREPSLDDVFLALTGKKAEAGEASEGGAQ